ncbi:(d)CMP kinase [Roseicitreum antarcticum]|uniref:Cytidylate kinase n=1 Tax=Roseicitreum antarcticum TaxID=564137 RepID=A0A1H2VRH8_9RHOB|nr:(d)CMP kinase [Roseicitreum antarcticum]SDW71002.1 cytidylate kinase [Roseicitreum antarcticum]
MGFTVAIDGPAAAGKGTISRKIADQFGLAHLDTGLLYRAVGRMVAEGAEPLAAAQALTPEDLNHPDLRSARAGEGASRVAVIPEVRAALLAFQRSFAARDGGAVLDGRDIGSVICPDADVKLFVTASDAVRAHRRWLELSAKGDPIAESEVLAQLRARDARDAARDAAPMISADDAVLLDTTELTIDAAVELAADLVSQRMRKGLG